MSFGITMPIKSDFQRILGSHGLQRITVKSMASCLLQVGRTENHQALEPSRFRFESQLYFLLSVSPGISHLPFLYFSFYHYKNGQSLTGCYEYLSDIIFAKGLCLAHVNAQLITIIIILRAGPWCFIAKSDNGSLS